MIQSRSSSSIHIPVGVERYGWHRSDWEEQEEDEDEDED
jgi:hypothetical protein